MLLEPLIKIVVEYLMEEERYLINRRYPELKLSNSCTAEMAGDFAVRELRNQEYFALDLGFRDYG